MKKNFSILCFFVVMAALAAPCPTSAQKHDYHWTLGYDAPPFGEGRADVLFHGGYPDTAFVYRDMRMGACASICDADGGLLFYTNGCYVAGVNHEPLPNGGGLSPGYVAGEFCGFGYPVGQGVLFLPLPGDDGTYYLFHLGAEIFPNLIAVNKFYYSVIGQGGGQWGVVQKNQLVREDTLATGKFTAARHANGEDWWLVLQKMFTNEYHTYLFTAGGIEGPYKQAIGPVNGNDWGIGQAVFSPDGTAYVHFDPNNHLNVFDFDRCTGLLSSPRGATVTGGLDSLSCGGVAISPNSRYLYVTTGLKVEQYDLWASPIGDSRVLVAEYDGFQSPGPTTFFLQQLAPDGKIYISSTSGADRLHVIHSPDSAGLACNLEQHGLGLPANNAFSVPNHPNYRLGMLEGYPEVCASPATENPLGRVTSFCSRTRSPTT